MMDDIYQKIKERNVPKLLSIYMGGGITFLGLVHLLSYRYKLPPYIFNTFLVFTIFGIFSTIIIAWYHGEKGRQKTKKIEIFFHSIIIVLAIYVSFLIRTDIELLPPNAKIVAVLPFTNMNDEEDDFFSDGITEDILTQLSKISDLKIISRTSVMKYKDTNMNINEIAQELNAGTILEGSVRRIGNKVRIVSQLINAVDDEHIWAETYDRDISDIFEVQSEIAKKIASELKAQLLPNEKALIDLKPTNNIDAYAQYLRGRNYYLRYTKEDNDKAIMFYKNALQIDSNYALAYAGLAEAYDQNKRKYFAAGDWRDSSVAMSRKALKLNPNLAEGHKALASNYDALEEYDKATLHYEKAIILNPNYHGAIYNLGTIKLNTGKLDKAYQLIKKSIQLRPDYIFGYVVLGSILQKLVCDSNAVKYYKKAISLDPEHLFSILSLSEQYLIMGNMSLAEKYFRKAEKISPDWFFVLFLGGRLELLKKNYKQADQYFNKYEEKYQSEREYFHGYVLLKLGETAMGQGIIDNELKEYLEYAKYHPKGTSRTENAIAEIYAINSDKKNAFKWLDKAINKGWVDYRYNLVYPYFNNVQKEKQFDNLIMKMKSKIDSMRTIVLENDPTLEFCE